jgi:hypothetical protein
MRRNSEQRGLPAPDLAMVRKDCLRNAVEAADLATIKDFLRFYAKTSRAKILEEPTSDSINTFTEWFFAGFARVTGTPIDGDVRTALSCVRT